MQTTEIALSQLVENKENPRTITEGQFSKLVQSILVFPKMMELRPIVIDETFTALGGNMRLKALCHIVSMDADSLELALSKEQRLTDAERTKLIEYWQGWQKKPTAITASASDLTEAQKREFIIKDNVAFGNWDYNELANKWNDLPLQDWGMNLFNDDLGSFFDLDDKSVDEDEKTQENEKLIKITVEIPQELSYAKDEILSSIDELLKSYNGCKVYE